MTHFIIDTLMEDAFDTSFVKTDDEITIHDDEITIREIKDEKIETKIDSPKPLCDTVMKDNFFDEFQKIFTSTLQSALEKKENKTEKFIMMTNVILVNN